MRSIFHTQKRKSNKTDLESKLDARNEKLGYRIREAQLAKIPYQIVLGDGEEENGTVTIRRAQGKDSTTLPLDAFIAMLKKKKWRKTFMKF